jgi:chemotaxis methyl-accepting protein methylase
MNLRSVFFKKKDQENPREHITRLFRNEPQLQLISRLLKEKQSPLKIKIFGVADGAEAVSLVCYLDPAQSNLEFFIEGSDISAGYIEDGRKFIYLPSEVQQHTNMDQFKNYIIKRWDGKYSLKNEWRKFLSLEQEDIFKSDYSASSGQYDLVMCQNVLTLMPKEKIILALDIFHKILKKEGYLAVAGGPLDIISNEVLKLPFQPIMQDVEKIHESWLVQRRAFEKPNRPAWSLEPFNNENSIDAVRYCSVFQKK